MIDLPFLARLSHSDALETDREHQHRPDHHRPCTTTIVYEPWLHSGVGARQLLAIIIVVQAYRVIE